MSASPKSAAAQRVLGAAHFLEFIYDGEAEWSLLAVKADIEPVTEAFTKRCKAKRCERNVEVKKAAGTGDELARLIAVVKVKDNPWTVIYWSLYHVNESALTGITRSAKELSTQFKTKSVTFASEDTSGAIASKQFENGKDSGTREFDDDEDINSFFAELGIYLPTCYPKIRGKRSWLAAEKSSAASIERADLIEL